MGDPAQRGDAGAGAHLRQRGADGQRCATTRRSCSWRRWRSCPASSATRWPCRTCTGATASRSAAWRRSTPTTGVITPGGIGFDINCGVRLLRTRLEVAAVEAVRDRLADRLFAAVPAGVGSSGAVPALSARDERRVLERGAAWAVEEGFGRASDLEHCEDGGRLARRRSGRRLRDGADAWPVAGRHARLRQSLPRGPAGGSDRRRAGRGRARHRGGTGRRHDPLGLARPRATRCATMPCA